MPQDLLADLEGLTPFQKKALRLRYESVTIRLQRRVLLYSCLFHIGHGIVTVGSLLVPALLSIQYTNTTGASLEYEVYWATWVVSLLVTTWNGILTLFKVDKKYYLLHTVLSVYESELHQYLTLTGKYGGHYTKGRVPTHENQYVYVCHHLEKLKLKQVEEEYYKSQNSHETNQHETAMKQTVLPSKKEIAGMFQPTPGDLETGLAKPLLETETSHADEAEESPSQQQSQQKDTKPPMLSEW